MTSQNKQDILALEILGDSPSYFVEFGADDGVQNSNTYILEKEYGWHGIVAEASIYCHDKLFANRSCHIETKCVYTQSDLEIDFTEVGNGLSAISEYADKDNWAQVRSGGTIYKVKTISLKDMLDKYDAPPEIGYLSIDTEGSEYDILNAYDFSRHFKLITVEHNYTVQREKIYDLLTPKGYKRIYEDISQWDDWYVYNA
jgi:FkbM family methyltransferase